MSRDEILSSFFFFFEFIFKSFGETWDVFEETSFVLFLLDVIYCNIYKKSCLNIFLLLFLRRSITRIYRYIQIRKNKIFLTKKIFLIETRKINID